jgi:endo-1,4-beta-D-glucanase Y
MHDLTVFQSGLWTVRYHQNKKWYGPYPVSLLFDTSLSKITGTGTDNSGNYTLDGSFSIKTRRIGLAKTYESNTHNEAVTIQLTWNAKSMQFEGKWYDKTLKLFGENKFELKFVRIQQSLTNEECNNA